jgi:hypothetical protein
MNSAFHFVHARLGIPQIQNTYNFKIKIENVDYLIIKLLKVCLIFYRQSEMLKKTVNNTKIMDKYI